MSKKNKRKHTPQTTGTVVTGVLLETDKENKNQEIVPAETADQIVADLKEKDEKKTE